MIQGLPERLKKLRIKYGFSQKSVADQLEVSPSIISGYETGERTPSVEVLLSLSCLYRCSTDYLLGKDLNDPELMLNVEGLTLRQIQAVTNLIESMRE